jgi:uncharacterized protein involved in exopolysaccharide biosynthesis
MGSFMELELSIRSALAMIFKHKLKIMAVFCMVMLAGIIYIRAQIPQYAAHASFLVKFGQDEVQNLVDNDHVKENGLSSSERAELMQSYINIIKGHDLVAAAIDKIGFDRVFSIKISSEKDAPAVKEKKIESFIKGNLEAEIMDRSNMIEMNVLHQNPQIAYALSKIILDSFLKYQSEIYGTTPPIFLQERLAEALKERDATQQVMARFKQEDNITDIDAEIDQLLQEKRELSNISFESSASNETNIANLITELETKKAELEATYRPDSVVLKKVNDSLKVAKGQLSAGGNMMSFKSKGISVGQSIETIDARIGFLEGSRGHYNELKQNMEATEESVKFLKQKLEEAKLNMALNQQNISRVTVIDKPDIPTIAIVKNKKVLLVAFFMIGGFLSILIALAAEIMDTRITYPEQLERMCQVPVITSFSEAELKI